MSKQIKSTVVNGIEVSTIQLPNDAFYRGAYETIVFDDAYKRLLINGPGDPVFGDMGDIRSDSYEQAMKDHQDGIEYVKGLRK